MPHRRDTFCRGVNLDLCADYTPNGETTEYYFCSTTYDLGVMSSFLSGGPATFFMMTGSFPNIAALSKYPQEEEYLVPLGTRFRVESLGRKDQLSMVRMIQVESATQW
mmetsp:Transcript_25879/g.61102  ORF Transcript_25879/g.61102 Transcript_25879/m.61102 type:complete len:108 (-) Transcript_25879:46-369(-)